MEQRTGAELFPQVSKKGRVNVFLLERGKNKNNRKHAAKKINNGRANREVLGQIRSKRGKTHINRRRKK